MSGCGEIDEEDVVPMPSATSDYEFENSADVYNSEDYKARTNCYAYALDVINNPVTGESLLTRNEAGTWSPWGAQPGMFAVYDNSYYYAEDSQKDAFVSLIKDDAKAAGWNLVEYKADLRGGYLIAIAVNLNIGYSEYHFYRENGDGTWSCKLGEEEVISGIENPQIDAYNRYYREFIGYFYLMKGEGCE